VVWTNISRFCRRCWFLDAAVEHNQFVVLLKALPPLLIMVLFFCLVLCVAGWTRSCPPVLVTASQGMSWCCTAPMQRSWGPSLSTPAATMHSGEQGLGAGGWGLGAGGWGLGAGGWGLGAGGWGLGVACCV
jgi:hypothetical protein